MALDGIVCNDPYGWRVFRWLRTRAVLRKCCIETVIILDRTSPQQKNTPSHLHRRRCCSFALLCFALSRLARCSCPSIPFHLPLLLPPPPPPPSLYIIHPLDFSSRCILLFFFLHPLLVILLLLFLVYINLTYSNSSIIMEGKSLSFRHLSSKQTFLDTSPASALPAQP